VEDPAQIEAVLSNALAEPGPAVVECLVDANEPPMPGHITVEMARTFAEALAKGDENRWDIIRTVLADKIREII
jgi:pyruvate dehydrogenase (quinone)